MFKKKTEKGHIKWCVREHFYLIWPGKISQKKQHPVTMNYMISGIKNYFKQRAGEYKGSRVGVEQDRKLIAGGGAAGAGSAVRLPCGSQQSD